MRLTNPPYALALSPLERMIAADEGFRSHPYRCAAGKLTIGYGSNIEAGWDQAMAVVVMRYQLHRLDADLRRRYPWYGGLNQNRSMAVLSMAYQLGLDGLAQFRRMLAACAKSDWPTAYAEAMDSKWARRDTPHRAARVAALLLDSEEE